MSVVGCSGEDFASILTALGFRRSRQKLAVGAAAPEATAADAAAQDPAPAAPDESVPDESAPAVTYDEIWRPAKRRNARHESKGHGNAKTRHGRKSARPPRQGEPVERTHKERPSPPEHSPFAALKELRQSLIARRQDG
jgi:ATP-dependent RNA helicase SUPV3L1/SUV3